MSITITTAAESYKLITVAQFKANIGLTTSTDDTEIGLMIDRVSAQIVAYCNQNFAKQTYTETLSGSGGKNLLLTNTPIVSITSITYDGTLVEASEYVLQEPGIGIVWNNNCWNYTRGEYQYSVVYLAGYILPSFTTGTPNLPLDIQAACLEMVKTMYYGRTRDSSISKEAVPDVYSVEYGTNGSSSNDSNKLLSGLATIGNHRRFNV